MSIRIQFDQPEQRCYTNLDFVSGKVILILPQDAAISAVTVKLEAESKTRLAAPKFPDNERSDKKRSAVEVHKLLYKVITVFPTPDLLEKSSGSAHTLLAGQYHYPFRFKFPFNNDCQKNPSPMKDLMQFAPDTLHHVKKTLPPSLSGFPSEADIVYFVKATIVRPKFFQENIRTIFDIKFLPIEPPRPPDNHQETFARRKRQFQRYPSEPQKKGLFGRKSSTPMAAEAEPPAFQVDARLPSPAIITCNESLPLRVLVEKINDSAASAYLRMLQIDLIGYTQVRAHNLDRTEETTWGLVSEANINMPLGNPRDRVSKQWKLPSRLWDESPLPSTVCPSFDTCNISRRYELEVRVGLAHATADGVRPELIILPLRLPVLVYSGIAPPAKLLEEMAKNPRPLPAPTGLIMPSQKPIRNGTPSPTETPLDTPLATPVTPYSEINSFPAQIGSYRAPDDSDLPDDAPPSYEDAMAEDLAPVDGPRRDYQVPTEPEVQLPAFNPNSKGGGLGRRASERLFSSNGSSPAPSRVSVASTMQGLTIGEDDTPDPPGIPAPVPVENSSRMSSWRKSFGGKKSDQESKQSTA